MVIVWKRLEIIIIKNNERTFRLLILLDWFHKNIMKKFIPHPLRLERVYVRRKRSFGQPWLDVVVVKDVPFGLGRCSCTSSRQQPYGLGWHEWLRGNWTTCLQHHRP